jgi:excisionase family DNA binding protein
MMDSVMSIAEFCELFRISKSSYYRMQKRGELPPVIKMGSRRVCFLTSDVEAWVAKLKVKGTAHENQ